MGVGEDLAPNKQVRQRVVYIAGGPDVSQEAPLEIRAIFCSAFPPPLKKLGDQGRSLDGGDRHPNRLVSNHFGHQQQQSTITRQSKTKTNKWPSSNLESSETFLPPPRPSEERRLRAQCVYSLHCQQHARAAGCARPPAHTHTHRHTHIQTHTQIRVGGAAARDSASLRESARHAGACSSAAAAAPRLEPRATRSPPASARPGYLCGDRGRRLRLPPAPPGAPPTRGSICRDLRVGVLFGGFCLGAAGATSRDAAQASLVAVSFFTLTLARCTSAPHPVPATSTPGRAATLLRAPPVASAAKFLPSRSARRAGAGVTCVKFRLGVGVAFLTPYHHLLFFFILLCDGGRGSPERGDCCWLTDDF